MLSKIKEKILAGGQATDDEIMSLADADPAEMREAAAAVSAAFVQPEFISCSIVNARSGKCSENCKWCAQSGHYQTGCHNYSIVDEEECMHVARYNAAKGIRMFSLVASGRKVSGEALDEMCRLLRRAKDETGIGTCASMGLLGREELQKLKDAGISRYHCNLETAPSHFGTLCTTHTIEDKLATIAIAHELGLQVCSGGIIGMGESRRQRCEFAVTLRRARPDSIPVNVLCPIPGTPLQDTKPISDDEILDAIAILRLAHPRVEIRFAGGRQKMSRAGQIEAMRIGVNGGIVGDLLTTVGSTIDEDKELCKEAGRKF